MYGGLLILSLALTAPLMFVFVGLGHIHQSLAQIITIIIVAGISFFVYKHIVFSSQIGESLPRP